uniref:Uncharacterized protein n=1 Tax=Sphaerodactylus townsendi TaxID=933632 RepID=A0ACB8FZJ9_9SAUR
MRASARLPWKTGKDYESQDASRGGARACAERRLGGKRVSLKWGRSSVETGPTRSPRGRLVQGRILESFKACIFSSDQQ